MRNAARKLNETLTLWTAPDIYATYVRTKQSRYIY